MQSDSFTKYIEESIEYLGQLSVRRKRMMKELLGFSLIVPGTDIYTWEYREEEYEQYRGMILDQIPRFKRYYQQDIFSRRLAIQFPIDYYEDKVQDYMPCPFSFLVQHKNPDQFDIIFNERSVEYTRAAEDVAIVYKICRDDLEIQGRLIDFRVHFMNIHKYEDGGSSEDFDVENGYFSKKYLCS